MRLLFKILLSVLVFVLLSGVGGYFYMRRKFLPPPNQLVVTGLPATPSFEWLADTAAGRAMPHAAVLVPVRLAGCPRTCYLQFDTGAPYSVGYSRPLAALQRRYPALAALGQPGADTLRNVQFALGQAQVRARWLRLLARGAAELPADSTAPFIIGTLGADVLEGRVLVLDYARRRFSLLAAVPDSLADHADFVPLAFTNRRVLLTMGLRGQPRQLLFDSGSSAFALLTSADEWNELARPGAPVRTVVVNSVGRPLTAHTAPTGATLRIGPVALPLGTTTYMEGVSWDQELMMRFSGMAGMLGNELFSDHTIILDPRGGRFGLLRP
jgi:hypothetical protein